ncbi:MAG: DUF1592 domain-containing protein [Acidimicrobiia bacterium]|nr:DUF1592 domain-containing protein [Acidimicrobiia bacterium]
MLRVLRWSVLVAGAGVWAGVLVGAQAMDTIYTYVRLSPTQYQHVIHDIFGRDIVVPANAVEPGVRDRGLLALGGRKLALSGAELERYNLVAWQIAAQVVDPARRATLIGCTPAAADAPDEACAAGFLGRVGPLLLRRPLTDDELRRYVDTARAATEALDDFYAGLEAALGRMLVAADFLFRTESSTPDPAAPERLRLDAYSRAARLSFLLWDSSPDAELLAAAGSRALMTEAGLREQVDRLLASPRLERGVRAFFSDMYEFDKFETLLIDSETFPEFIPSVEADAREQTLRTIADHLLNRNGDYRDLLVTRDTFLTPALAALYAVPLARSQELGGAVPWTPYRFPDGTPYMGVLSHVSFLSLHGHPGASSPTLRGKALREKFLCQTIPPPPADVDFSAIEDSSTHRTVRERLDAHRTNRACASCHRMMDPIGLAFEGFDAASRHRTTENGAPIDTSGELNGQTFTTASELAVILRNEPAVTSCVVDRAFSYGTQRMPTKEERGWLTALATDLRGSGVTWRALMRRLALEPDFHTIPAADVRAER